SLAHAGFRHPVEETGIEAQEIENTPIHPGVSTVSSSKRLMPDRAVGNAMPSRSPAPASAAPMAYSAPVAPRAFPAAPQQQTYGPKLPAFHAKAMPKMERLPQHVKGTIGNAAPVPKAPALPSAEHIGVPDVQLPQVRDGLLSMKPEHLNLKGLNRPQIHAFLKHARDLPVPNHEYSNEVRSRAVAERFKDALHPVPYRSFRTKYSLSLAKVGKIQQPPAVTQYENMVKRIDSLFLGLDYAYPKAVMGLWQLAESSTNPRDLQARDALFAGLLAERAGWETTTAMMLEEAAAKRVEKESRYLKILWGQIEGVPNQVHVDKIVAAVSPLKVRDTAPVGDRANYAMAKRLLMTRHRAPAAVFPSSDVYAVRISSKDLRDKLSLLALVAQVRSVVDSKREAALNGLRAIETTGSDENRQQARLTLARALLQKGSAVEALELYQKVKKDGRNRLNVLAEQTYAEYVNGAYQDSLGKTVALQTPYFQYGFAPDIHLVEIMTRKAMCDFGGAEAALKRFGDRYVRELNALEDTIAHRSSPASYYEELVGYANVEQPYRYQRYLLQLPSVMENQKTMNQALGELKKLDELGVHQKSLERPEGWDEFTASLRQRWNNRAGELRTASADTALKEVAYMAKRLRNTFAQVELLDLDISTGAAKNYNLQSALNFPARKQEQAKADEDKLRWPFQSEIWEDEIDFMKAKNPSKCAVTAAL
ncbi:MAG: hypothetical protein ACXVB9_05605, partial [Bdellovibrionota bacterium]